MLGLIKRWLWNRRRQIFRFNDGRKVRTADPIAVAMALHEHKTFLPRHLGEAAEGDVESQRIVAQTACDVFGLSPLAADGSGLTMAELIELMMAFDAYLFALKKNIERSLTPSVFTVPASPPSNGPTTSDTSVSGSTATDPQSVNQRLLETESSPLSEN